MSLYFKDNIGQQYNPQKIITSNDVAYRQLLGIRDCIECSNRYIWEGLENITSQQLETMIYQNGSILATLDDDDNLIFTRYAGVGKLNVNGQQEKIKPISFDGKPRGTVKNWVQNTKVLIDEKDVGIIINDYTSNIYNVEVVPRSVLNNQTTINDQAYTYKLLQTETILSVKKILAKCTTAEQRQTVIKQAREFLNPDNIILALVSDDLTNKIDVAELNNNFNISNYMIALEYYDKVRRQFNGVPSPDNIEKKERLITGEIEDSQTHTDIILSDGLEQRKKACELINHYFNKNLSVRLNKYLEDEESEEKEVEEEEQE